jgi:hypothetical protein
MFPIVVAWSRFGEASRRRAFVTLLWAHDHPARAVLAQGRVEVYRVGLITAVATLLDSWARACHQ